MTAANQDADEDLRGGSYEKPDPDTEPPLDQRIDAVVAKFVEAGWPEPDVRVCADRAIGKWIEAGLRPSQLEQGIELAGAAVGGNPCRYPVLWLEKRLFDLIVEDHVQRQQAKAST